MNTSSFILVILVAGGMVTIATSHNAHASTRYTIVADADTTAYTAQPQKNFGREPYLFLTNNMPTFSLPTASILLHFNLSSIPINPGDHVSSAQLQLTQVTQRGWGSMTIIAHALADQFSETQTVWNQSSSFFNAQSYNTWAEHSPSVTVKGVQLVRKTVTFDVKNIARRWLETGTRNDGIVLTSSSYIACHCASGLMFFSRESRDLGSPDLQDFPRPTVGAKPTLTIDVESGAK